MHKAAAIASVADFTTSSHCTPIHVETRKVVPKSLNLEIENCIIRLPNHVKSIVPYVDAFDTNYHVYFYQSKTILIINIILLGSSAVGSKQ